jgi:hypothetical protein
MPYKIISQEELEKMIEKTRKGEGYTLHPFDTTGPISPHTPVIGVCRQGVGYFSSKKNALAYAKAHPKTTTITVPGGKITLRQKVKNYDLPENREYEFCPVTRGLKLKTGGGFTAVCKVTNFKKVKILTLAGKIIS